MRWRFIDPKNLREAEERRTIVATIDAWWREFQTQANTIDAHFRRRVEFDVPDWMATHLSAIHPGLMWEYGQAVRGSGHRLVITPEADHELRPLVRVILERAPAIVGWEFYEYRLAENLEHARAAVQGRTGQDLEGFTVRVARGEGHRIDLTYYPPAIPGRDATGDADVAFVATECLLGERMLDHWIGGIEADAPPRQSALGKLFRRSAPERPSGLPLERMQETVAALVESIRDQLPPSAHAAWIEKAEWSMWQLKPQEADDYAGQSDLFVGKSANPPMWMAAHSGQLFFSERFSRCDEVFCYLKLDGAEGLEGSEFADKAEIEDALDDALKKERLGCQIGGGTGLRYSYIDLALPSAKLDEALQTIRRRLQQGKAPVRSWIQFFDSDWAAEWVGVYDETPPPLLDSDTTET